MMDYPIEYFHGEVMRWSFGFDNPNKAAVLFAFFVPILWAGWLAGCREGKARRKAAMMVACGLGFLGVWLCLLLTFSRGGVVGALAGMVVITAWAFYFADNPAPWRVSSSLHGSTLWLSVVLAALVLGAAVSLGVAARSLEAVSGDASVGNRLELWEAALQMGYENPRGFGAGQSGDAFMQWYQDTGRTEGYRTMVNSYLTLLVEQGWLPLLFLLVAVAALWAWSWPAKSESLGGWRAAWWGSLCAFLVSGVFSTTVENQILLLLPLVAVCVLVGCSRRAERSGVRQRLATALAVVLVMSAGLFALGWHRSSKDPLRREFGDAASGRRSVIAIEPRTVSARKPTVGVLPDERVLGLQRGKLLRDLALRTDSRVQIVEEQDQAVNVSTLLVCGAAVLNLRGRVNQRLVLLAPAEVAGMDFQPMSSVALLLPGIDEDGRGSAWRRVFAESGGAENSVRELSGVGTNVEWAWNEVVEVVMGL